MIRAFRNLCEEKRSDFPELKRRNVLQVAVSYAIVGWLLVQIATQFFPFLEFRTWFGGWLNVIGRGRFPSRARSLHCLSSHAGRTQRSRLIGRSCSVARHREYTMVFVVSVAAALSAWFVFSLETLHRSASAGCCHPNCRPIDRCAALRH